MEYSEIIGKYSDYFPTIRTHFLYSFMNQVIFVFCCVKFMEAMARKQKHLDVHDRLFCLSEIFYFQTRTQKHVQRIKSSVTEKYYQYRETHKFQSEMILKYGKFPFFFQNYVNPNKHLKYSLIRKSTCTCISNKSMSCNFLSLYLLGILMIPVKDF